MEINIQETDREFNPQQHYYDKYLKGLDQVSLFRHLFLNKDIAKDTILNNNFLNNRRGERSPSLYFTTFGNYIGEDFGIIYACDRGNSYYNGNVIQVYKKIFGIEKEDKEVSDQLKIVYPSILNTVEYVPVYIDEEQKAIDSRNVITLTDTLISVKTGAPDQKFIDYFKEYGIVKAVLNPEKYGLYCLNQAVVSIYSFNKYGDNNPLQTGCKKYTIFKEDSLLVGYLIKKEAQCLIAESDYLKPIWKLNMPFVDKKNRFKYNGNHLTLQGKDDIDNTGDKLIITKQGKDFIWYKENVTNNVLGTSSESADCFAGKNEEFLRSLKSRFKSIYVLYDNDATGVRESTRLMNTFGIYRDMVPLRTDTKDITDFTKKNGLAEGRRLANKMIDND